MQMEPQIFQISPVSVLRFEQVTLALDNEILESGSSLELECLSSEKIPKIQKSFWGIEECAKTQGKIQVPMFFAGDYRFQLKLKSESKIYSQTFKVQHSLSKDFVFMLEPKVTFIISEMITAILYFPYFSHSLMDVIHVVNQEGQIIKEIRVSLKGIRSNSLKFSIDYPGEFYCIYRDNQYSDICTSNTVLVQGIEISPKIAIYDPDMAFTLSWIVQDPSPEDEFQLFHRDITRKMTSKGTLPANKNGHLKFFPKLLGMERGLFEFFFDRKGTVLPRELVGRFLLVKDKGSLTYVLEVMEPKIKRFETVTVLVHASLDLFGPEDEIRLLGPKPFTKGQETHWALKSSTLIVNMLKAGTYRFGLYSKDQLLLESEPLVVSDAASEDFQFEITNQKMLISDCELEVAWEFPFHITEPSDVIHVNRLDGKCVQTLFIAFDSTETNTAKFSITEGGKYFCTYVNRQSEELARTNVFFINQLLAHPKLVDEQVPLTVTWIVDNPSQEDALELYDPVDLLICSWPAADQNYIKMTHKDFPRNGKYKFKYVYQKDPTINLEAKVTVSGLSRIANFELIEFYELETPAKKLTVQPWVPSDPVLTCFNCTKFFNFIRRKHHCRLW
jgi:hypothetical protein